MREWMDARGFTSPRLRWFVQYATRDDYGTLLDDTSAWAGVFYFAARDVRPSVTWPGGNGRAVRHLARFVRSEDGVKEVDFYERLSRIATAEPLEWPMLAAVVKIVKEKT